MDLKSEIIINEAEGLRLINNLNCNDKLKDVLRKKYQNLLVNEKCCFNKSLLEEIVKSDEIIRTRLKKIINLIFTDNLTEYYSSLNDKYENFSSFDDILNYQKQLISSLEKYIKLIEKCNYKLNNISYNCKKKYYLYFKKFVLENIFNMKSDIFIALSNINFLDPIYNDSSVSKKLNWIEQLNTMNYDLFYQIVENELVIKNFNDYEIYELIMNLIKKAIMSDDANKLMEQILQKLNSSETIDKINLFNQKTKQFEDLNLYFHSPHSFDLPYCFLSKSIRGFLSGIEESLNNCKCYIILSSSRFEAILKKVDLYIKKLCIIKDFIEIDFPNLKKYEKEISIKLDLLSVCNEQCNIGERKEEFIEAINELKNKKDSLENNVALDFTKSLEDDSYQFSYDTLAKNLLKEIEELLDYSDFIGYKEYQINQKKLNIKISKVYDYVVYYKTNLLISKLYSIDKKGIRYVELNKYIEEFLNRDIHVIIYELILESIKDTFKNYKMDYQRFIRKVKKELDINKDIIFNGIYIKQFTQDLVNKKSFINQYLTLINSIFILFDYIPISILEKLKLNLDRIENDFVKNYILFNYYNLNELICELTKLKDSLEQYKPKKPSRIDFNEINQINDEISEDQYVMKLTLLRRAKNNSFSKVLVKKYYL